jgi:ABC-type hemin transport system ATPase subunit
MAGVHGVLARVAWFVVAWLTSVLTTLRLIARPHEVALLGLDNAGKTTLLQVLTGNRVSPTRAAGEWGSE